MEFQSYPSHADGNRATSFQAMGCKLTNALHNGESLLLPASLMLAAAGLVAYEHFVIESEAKLGGFLAMVWLTMLPLAILEKKLFAITDPLNAISQMSGKILLSHASFMVVRLVTHYMDSGLFNMRLLVCFGGLAAAYVLCLTVYRMHSLHALFVENRDVWSVVSLGLVTAALTEGVRWYHRGVSFRESGVLSAVMVDINDSAGIYLELLAFVPAIMLVCRIGKTTRTYDKKDIDVDDTRMRAFALFSFLVVFYFHEDVVAGIPLWKTFPTATMGHMAHFLLLMDFCCYLLWHLYDPAKVEKLAGAIRDIFSEMWAV